MLGKHPDAYSTQIGNPFGTAALEAARKGRGIDDQGDSRDLSIGQRVIRNQVLTRGAPIAGRALTVMGAAAVGAGISIQRRNVTSKRQFSTMTKRQARYAAKQEKGTHLARKYGRTYTAEYWRTTRHYKPWLRRDVGQQRMDTMNRTQSRNLRRGAVLKGAGTTMIIAGKTLPVLAYGYIAYDLKSRGASRTEARQELERATFGLSTEEAIETTMQVYTAASIGYALAKPALALALEVVI